MSGEHSRCPTMISVAQHEPYFVVVVDVVDVTAIVTRMGTVWAFAN